MQSEAISLSLSPSPSLPSLSFFSPSTLVGSRLFRFTAPRGIPRGWLTEHTSYQKAQTGPKATSNSAENMCNNKHTFAHPMDGQGLHQFSCGWWRGAEGKEVAFERYTQLFSRCISCISNNLKMKTAAKRLKKKWWKIMHVQKALCTAFCTFTFLLVSAHQNQLSAFHRLFLLMHNVTIMNMKMTILINNKTPTHSQV